MTTMSAVMMRPITAQPNNPPEVKVTPAFVLNSVANPPNSAKFTSAMATMESAPAVMRPL